MSEISHIILPDETTIYFKDAEARADIEALEALDPIPSPDSPTTGDVLTWDGNSWEAAPPQGGDVTDVTVNGTSVVDANGVAEIPLANGSTAGVITFGTSNPSIARASSGYPYVVRATDAEVKAGSNSYKPIVPASQHQAAFYGLAEAAGDSTQSASSNPVGSYTDGAKESIKEMLGVTEDVESLEEQLVWRLDYENATEIVAEQSVSFASDSATNLYKHSGNLTGLGWTETDIVNYVYEVTWDGTAYRAIMWHLGEAVPNDTSKLNYCTFLGNTGLLGYRDPLGVTAPFLFKKDTTPAATSIYTSETDGTHTISIVRYPVIFNPIKKSMQPLISVDAAQSIAIGGAKSAGFNGVGIGEGAVAGQQGIAIGNCADAGRLGVSIGTHTKASNFYATAVGYTSEATGAGATAIGAAKASGQFAVGLGVSEATGNRSTAMNLSTASSECQTTTGKWNVADSSNVYAFIIGDGTSNNARHNLFTIAWDGTVVSNGKTLATTDQIPETAEDITYNSSTAYTAGTVGKALSDANGAISDIRSAITSAMHYVGVTTTALTDGSTTSVIVIDGDSYTAVSGDVAIYQEREYVYNGAKWQEFGSSGSLKALAFKDSASGSYTPSGSVSAPTVTVNLNSTTVNSIADVGTLPSCTLPVLTSTFNDGNLAFAWTAGSFSAGTLPTKGADTPVATSVQSATASQPTFSGNAATIEVS